MLNGTFVLRRVVEESLCRSTKKYRFINPTVYKIHSTSLMPNIPFGEAQIQPQSIDKSIFVNDNDTKLDFPNTINCQNFLSTQYIGRLPYKEYAPGEYSPIGTEFTLLCRNGNPNAKYRTFGTEDAMQGYSTSNLGG